MLKAIEIVIFMRKHPDTPGFEQKTSCSGTTHRYPTKGGLWIDHYIFIEHITKHSLRINTNSFCQQT